MINEEQTKASSDELIINKIINRKNKIEKEEEDFYKIEFKPKKENKKFN